MQTLRAQNKAAQNTWGHAAAGWHKKAEKQRKKPAGRLF